MRARVITSQEQFDALASVWRQMLEESNESSPFLSHDWFACCWRRASVDRAPEVTIIEDATGPVALFPLVRYRTTVRGVPVRALAFLDSPDTAFAGFPVARDIATAVRRFVNSLHARRDWDVLSLHKIPTDSAILKALVPAMEDRFGCRAVAGDVSPYLSLSGSWEPYFREKTQRFRKTCRNIENRLQRAGAVTVEEHRAVDPDGSVFAELMDVSIRSWKAPRGVAMATMHGMQTFFRELTRRATANAWLHVWILRLDGRAIATEYHLAGGGVIHALRADFDTTLAAMSPGAYLNAVIIRSLFERPDIHEYDMGPGTNDYKLRWASGTRDSIALTIYAPSARGRVLDAVERHLVPLARRWRAGAARAAV